MQPGQSNLRKFQNCFIYIQIIIYHFTLAEFAHRPLTAIFAVDIFYILQGIRSFINVLNQEAGFSVVRQFVGHGIGRALHEEPALPNFGRPGEGPVLKQGMVLAIEPMVNAGRYEVEIGADRWKVITRDGSLSCHFEHTVAVTGKQKPEILTLCQKRNR